MCSKIKYLLLIFLFSVFIPHSTICNENPVESSILFPPGTIENIKVLFFKLAKRPSNGSCGMRPGFARIFYNQEMINIANSKNPITTEVLLANIGHPTICRSSIQILGDLRVKEAIPTFIKILSDRPKNYAHGTLISLTLNSLARITQHHYGYHFYRRAWMPKIIDQAVIEYKKWYRNNKDKLEGAVLTKNRYNELYEGPTWDNVGTGYPGPEFYLPMIPDKPEYFIEDVLTNIERAEHITNR